MAKKINFVEKISTNLRLLLKHHDISLRCLAKAVNVTPAHLTKLSQREYISPGLDILEKIADYFKISIAQLIGEQKIDFETLPKLDCKK